MCLITMAKKSLLWQQPAHKFLDFMLKCAVRKKKKKKYIYIYQITEEYTVQKWSVLTSGIFM